VQHIRLPLRALLALLILTGVAGCDYLLDASDRLERAQTFVEQGDRRRAVVELRNALEQQPDMPQARLLLAEVAYWLGDVASAARELEKLPADFEPARRVALQARLELAAARFDSALQNADKLPDGAQRALLRGQALTGLRRLEDAQAEFRTALAADPKLVEAATALIENRALQGDVAGALESSRPLLAQFEDAAQVWFIHGALLARQADVAGASAALARARELAPKQITVMQQVALFTLSIDVQLAQHDLEGARDSNSKLARLIGNAPLVALATARIAMEAGEHAAAAAELRKVVNGAPQLAGARYLLAVALAADGNLEQASTELATVVRESPANSDARELLARVRMRLDDPDGALRLLVPALQADGNDPKLANLADQLLAHADGSTQSIEILQAALAKAPKDRELALRLARAWWRKGDGERVLTILKSIAPAPGDARREALLLQATMQARGAPAARKELARLESVAVDDTSRIVLVGAFHAQLGEVAEGRRVITAALARMPADVDLWNTLAQIELAAKRPAEARAALEHVVQIKPAHAGARLMLARLAALQGDRSAATAQLEALRAADPEAVQARLALADLALARDDAKTANALVTEILAAEPAKAGVRDAVGLLFLRHARYERAAEHFRAAAEQDPGSAGSWLNLGRAQLALQQYPVAEGSLARALRLKPGWIQAETALVFLDLQSGARDRALARVAELRKTRPRDADVLTLEGDLRSALAQHREASAAYDAALALAPSATLALRSLAARNAAKLPEPTQALEIWVRAHPADLEPRRALADALVRAGASARAVEHLRAVIELRPKDVVALNNLAWIYYEQGDARALPLARQAAALAPDHPSVNDTLGWILAETNHLEEATSVLARAAGAPDATPSIRYHYGAALLRAGQAEQGRHVISELLESGANFPERQAASRLLEDLSKGPGAGA
jgi:cellulose synthase operon protein C